MFSHGNCTIIVELIAYLRRAMLGKCFVLFLLISRVTQHDWYLRSFARSFSIVFLDADATSVMTGGLQRSTVRKQCAFAMLGTQTRWPSGSSGSRGIEVIDRKSVV